MWFGGSSSPCLAAEKLPLSLAFFLARAAFSCSVPLLYELFFPGCFVSTC